MAPYSPIYLKSRFSPKREERERAKKPVIYGGCSESEGDPNVL